MTVKFGAILAFQSTHPAWGVTGSPFVLVKQKDVSIHTPRVGCDIYTIRRFSEQGCFNPHTPRGV